MLGLAVHLVALHTSDGNPLAPGDHTRTLQVGGRTVPTSSSAAEVRSRTRRPSCLFSTGRLATLDDGAGFAGSTKKADKEGFIVVYPNGTGTASLF